MKDTLFRKFYISNRKNAVGGKQFLCMEWAFLINRFKTGVGRLQLLEVKLWSSSRLILCNCGAENQTVDHIVHVAFCENFHRVSSLYTSWNGCVRCVALTQWYLILSVAVLSQWWLTYSTLPRVW